MNLEFLKNMDEGSLLSIIKQASIQINASHESTIEVLQKQAIGSISTSINKIHNQFNKNLAHTQNISAIQKSEAVDKSRNIAQSKIEKISSSNFEQPDLALPDLSSAIDNLTQSLERLDLSRKKNGIAADVVEGAKTAAVAAGIKRLAPILAPVAGATALVLGAHKVAETVAPAIRAVPAAASAMLRSRESKSPIKRATGVDATSIKKGRSELTNLSTKAVTALKTPATTKKQPIIEKDSISSRFSDYISDTIKNVNSHVTSIPERLANTGNSLYEGAASAIEGAAAGFDAEMAGGAVAAPYSFVKNSIGASSQKWDVFRNTIAQIESRGRYDIQGGYNNHYDGRYQMGKSAKADAARILKINIPHTTSAREQFRNDKDLQEKAFAAFTSANDSTLKRLSPRYKGAAIDEKLQILGYAHNQGAGGAIKWLKTGRAGKDGFGTSGAKYSSALASTLRNPNASRVGRQAGKTVGAVGNYITNAFGKMKDLVGSTFTLGGGITGNKKNLMNWHPKFESAVAGAITEYHSSTGRRPVMTSGFRYPGDQARISGKNGTKAAPGNSRHETGQAVDFNGADVDRMRAMGILDRYGLSQPFPQKDNVHIQLKGGRLAAAKIDPAYADGEDTPKPAPELAANAKPVAQASQTNSIAKKENSRRCGAPGGQSSLQRPAPSRVISIGGANRKAGGASRSDPGHELRAHLGAA